MGTTTRARGPSSRTTSELLHRPAVLPVQQAGRPAGVPETVEGDRLARAGREEDLLVRGAGVLRVDRQRLVLGDAAVVHPGGHGLALHRQLGHVRTTGPPLGIDPGGHAGHLVAGALEAHQGGQETGPARGSAPGSRPGDRDSWRATAAAEEECGPQPSRCHSGVAGGAGSPAPSRAPSSCRATRNAARCSAAGWPASGSATGTAAYRRSAAPEQHGGRQREEDAGEQPGAPEADLPRRRPRRGRSGPGRSA